MASNIDLQPFWNAVKTELDVILATLRDKGAQRFSKAFGLAGVCAALAYFGVYSPPQAKIARLTREIERAKAMSESGAQYKDLRDRLAAAYGVLPKMKDREQWLSGAVIDSLRAATLTPDSFKPVGEQEAGGLIFQSSTLQLTIRFSELHAWLARLERIRPMLHVSSLDVQKKAELLGSNVVTCEVTTVIAKQRFD